MTDKVPSGVNGSPTKDLFISTLVKDIPLDRAILDLIDNCVDGAKRLRGGGALEGLWIHIEATKDRFSIADNCGGIPLGVAENYAFRFGRPAGMPATPHSVGQFGVGMKRALFKLGTEFSVRSTAEESMFAMSLKVDDWKNQHDENGNDVWTFPLTEARYVEAETPTADRGTTITVSKLHDSVSSEFGLGNFITHLSEEVGLTQQFSIERHLTITLNGVDIVARPIRLASSRDIRPAFLKYNVNGSRPPVQVRLYVGITRDERTEFSEAGWYVFCNERLVLAGDQTQVTGWEQVSFHPRFNRFRGYAFFDSDDASRLPWNTMKTGVDVNAPLYAAIRLHMINSMTPVLDFLNNYAKETASGDSEQPLHTAVENASMVTLDQLTVNKRFEAPSPEKKPRKVSRLQWIKYQRPKREIERAKEVLKVSTASEVGEESFQYFYDHECDE